MLVLSPELVKFGSAAWTDVTLVAVDRETTRPAPEWGDLGPHVTFVDAPERRTTIRIIRRLLRDDLGAPRPGDSAEVVFYTSPAAADALRKRVRAAAVVTTVAYELSKARGALQTITMICVSSDGAAEPVIVEDAPDGGV